MKVVRWFVAGLAFGIISQIVGGIIYGGIFAHWYDCCSQLFRPMDSPLFTIGLSVMNLVQGLLLAAIYPVFYKGIPTQKPISKGVIFGLLLWIATALPGMLTDFCVTNMRFPLPCLIYTLITMVVGCLVIGAIWGKSLETKKNEE
ncbi:MAG: hypothetical protein AB1422_16795 [bacterium]